MTLNVTLPQAVRARHEAIRRARWQAEQMSASAHRRHLISPAMYASQLQAVCNEQEIDVKTVERMLGTRQEEIAEPQMAL